MNKDLTADDVRRLARKMHDNRLMCLNHPKKEIAYVCWSENLGQYGLCEECGERFEHGH